MSCSAKPSTIPSRKRGTHVLTSYFADYANSNEAEVRERALRRMYRALAEDPSLRPVELHIWGYLVEFFASEGHFARYVFILWREEPFKMPPPPAE